MIAVVPAALCCLLWVICHVADATLTVGAFNIQRLSSNKVDNPEILDKICTILYRFDVVCIEEVMDEAAIHTVLDEMNRRRYGPWSMTISAKTGRTSYKEYFAILYRTDKVSLKATTQYPDTQDHFERDPFSALFHTTHSGVSEFALMGVHLKPADVFTEMNYMDDVYEHAVGVLHTHNFIIAGDYNADCRYLSNVRYQHTDLLKDDRFWFLVDRTADTTATHTTDCAYDRFIATGEVRSYVVPDSVKVYNFETGLHLSYEMAMNISDHYPIEMKLQ